MLRLIFVVLIYGVVMNQSLAQPIGSDEDETFHTESLSTLSLSERQQILDILHATKLLPLNGDLTTLNGQRIHAAPAQPSAAIVPKTTLLCLATCNALASFASVACSNISLQAESACLRTQEAARNDCRNHC